METRRRSAEESVDADVNEKDSHKVVDVEKVEEVAGATQWLQTKGECAFHVEVQRQKEQAKLRLL